MKHVHIYVVVVILKFIKVQMEDIILLILHVHFHQKHHQIIYIVIQDLYFINYYVLNLLEKIQFH